MWDIITDYFPGWLTLFCTALIFAIPFSIYKINQMLNKYGSPAWKRDDEHKES